VPDRPLVSVVTPTLNQAQFIEATIRSVRAQTYPRIEHIVIDGGSTDGTIELLQREAAADPAGGRPMVGLPNGALQWQSGPDRGMYDAINKGLALAHGDIRAYLNSDDSWLPWAVEAAVRVFETKPDVDLVYGDGVKVYPWGMQRLRLFPPFDRVSLANYESLMQPAVFWRRRLEERIGGFDTNMRFVADLDYWLRAAEAGARIAHVREVLAIERIHESRLSKSQGDAMAAEDAAMRAKHAGVDGGAAGRERAVARDIRWQRRLWLNFVVASDFRRIPGPWHRFLRDAGVQVKRSRAISGSRPEQAQLLRNAVVSQLVGQILGVEASPVEAPPPMRKRLRRMVRQTLRRLGLRRGSKARDGGAPKAGKGGSPKASADASAPAMPHGHGLVQQLLPDVAAHVAPGHLIEIGSTREKLPGQGSTVVLAGLARELGLPFVTVDMDPANTEQARADLAPFPGAEAVTARGEEYLASFEHPVVAAYLDAFDIQHGQHSDYRIDRYRQFLGTEITNEGAGAMHLACAQALLPRLVDGGLIVIDDTWPEGDGYAGKGSLAVPALLAEGFKMVGRTRTAVALRRDTTGG
jgi:glycosyltransferase involved in cell wall biosynthesis